MRSRTIPCLVVFLLSLQFTRGQDAVKLYAPQHCHRKDIHLATSAVIQTFETRAFEPETPSYFQLWQPKPKAIGNVDRSFTVRHFIKYMRI